MPKARQQTNRSAPVRERLAGPPANRSAAADAAEEPGTMQRQIVTLDEAAAAYEGEWALMRVVGSDPETHGPIGEVLIHSPSRREINKVLKRVWSVDREAELAVVLGGTQRRSPEEIRALLERSAGGPYVNARW